jgi:hypothetical protein
MAVTVLSLTAGGGARRTDALRSPSVSPGINLTDLTDVTRDRLAGFGLIRVSATIQLCSRRVMAALTGERMNGLVIER